MPQTMPRTMIFAVLAGVASGVVFIAPMYESVLGMLFINFTHLPLFLVGLGLGTVAVGVAALTGTVFVGVAHGVGPLLSFLAIIALPTALAVRQALLWRKADDGKVAWYPPGRLLALMVCYGAAAFILLYMVMGNDNTGGGIGMIESMRALLDEMFSVMAPNMAGSERLLAADLWAPYIPAALIVSWIITLTINGAFAQKLLKKAGRNVRPTLEYSQTELPLPFVFALVASGALWYFTSGVSAFFGQTLTIIIALAYLFVGLTVVHKLSQGWPMRPFVLTLFYLMLLFLLGWPGLALVAGVGLADQLFQLRPRFAGPAPHEEDE